MMIKNALLYISIIALFACQNNENSTSDGITIYGSIDDQSITDLVLFKVNNNGGQIILDSSKVNDGNYSFNINTQLSNQIYYIGSPSSRKTLNLILSPSDKDVKIDISELNEKPSLSKYKVSGSPFSKEMNTFYKSMQEIFKKRMDVSQKIRNLYAQMDATNEIVVEGDDTLNIAYYQNQMKIIGEEEGKEVQTFIDKHLESPALYAVLEKVSFSNPENFKKVMVSLQKQLPKSAEINIYKGYLQQIQQQEERMKAHTAYQNQMKEKFVGKKAPELNFPNPQGKNISLSSLKGKVVMLDFWASWCGPCRKENPNIVKLYKKYKDKGFDIYSFSLDKNKERWIAAIAQDNLSWNNHTSDLKQWASQGARLYGVNSIPMTFIIGRDGKVIDLGLRGAQLESKIEELINS